MDNDQLSVLRKQLVSAIGGRESHIDFRSVIKDFPQHLWGKKPSGAPHSAWQLLEHMRIAQQDILEFSRNPNHDSPKFPEGYWPETDAPPNEQAWARSIHQFEKDERELKQLIESADLFTPFPHGQGQTLLREALVLANHNSYTLGQLMFLKKTLAGKVSGGISANA